MFHAGSWLESLNIYIVENIVHSAVALGLVWLILALFKIKEPALRIKFLLLPLALPIFTPILFYLLFPQRQGMSVLPVDKMLNLRAAFPDPALWKAVSSLLTAALLVVAAFLLLKGALSLFSLLWLPRRFRQIKKGENSQLDAILETDGARAGNRRPKVLLSPSSEVLCCSFGLVKPYLLISYGLLLRLNDSQIEAVVAHEVGHIRRRDGWLGFALVTLRHILFFNPVVHLVSRRLRLESEMAADDAALGRGLDRSTYAQTLVAVCRLAAAPQAAHLGWSAFSAGAWALRRRVEHVLEPGSISGSSYQRWLPVPMAVGLLVILFFLC
ncbi:MAG: M56 family metallopeptidase [Chloroflexi bacterium]|nr:M56 family metallopeptidase [Chloroflexota bacterium]